MPRVSPDHGCRAATIRAVISATSDAGVGDPIWSSTMVSLGRVLACSMTLRRNPGLFNDIVATAGIAKCTVHDLRRTFCTDLARLGVNQSVVQRLAGHVSPATTERYYQYIDDETKRDAVSRLSAG